MKEKNIDEIIENPMTEEQITEMYFNGQLKRNEWSLLVALNKNGEFLKHYFLGLGGFGLNFDSTVNQNSYFQNIPAMLEAFYSLYHKYPNYHLDQVLKEGLNRLSNDELKIYQFLKIFSQQMENEEKNISPFKVIDKNMLENCRINFLRFKDNLKSVKLYDAWDRENGYVDVIADMNQEFKDKLDYDIFDDSPEKKTL